ncbi:MAG: ABC transporter, permease protein 1 (cluster 1, maltose/g3p/polyamine/iron) [uncultured Microvirga sp.]|uniref:ABC transporter, permease protein 1 (Cluster 1, maltose/g3p/polyamine/iron) n=1 Tax=uncultured Microvirga sp. TaxID=412392 RepID=A0A6J4KRY9_9HYPH|nr:MAG: ABC transporter, permease protein 1 (cluster 1, maltose/g3p/polyamine/iron) [uncultured Microvirga sp.]
MRRRTFLAFIAPSLAMMAIFIALPLVSVFWQSFHTTQRVFHDVTVESCSPGILQQICKKEVRSVPMVDEQGRPVTRTAFIGWESYGLLLQPATVMSALAEGWSGLSRLLDLEFYRALRFTLTFALITLPFVIGLGLLIALMVDSTARSLRGPIIFVSLLPYIITPVIGALSIRWLFIGDGIMTAALSALFDQRIYMFAQGWTIELLMLFYRVWHVAPFAFVVFYAGLQTVDQDTLESAIVDGASRFERLRYVVIPHLAPLIVFVSLIHLMDAYRVFEEVIGFSSQAHRISLQWLTFHYLMPDETGNRAISRASASAMLTVVGVALLLTPLLVRTWRDQRRVI